MRASSSLALRPERRRRNPDDAALPVRCRRAVGVKRVADSSRRRCSTRNGRSNWESSGSKGAQLVCELGTRKRVLPHNHADPHGTISGAPAAREPHVDNVRSLFAK